jgi:hypothetical protein
VHWRLSHSSELAHVAPADLRFAQTPFGLAVVAVQYKPSRHAAKRVARVQGAATAPLSWQTPPEAAVQNAEALHSPEFAQVSPG